jgi:CDP-diacylglycerol--glycerol-3-phosphate 3-phosphatidyltransferase
MTRAEPRLSTRANALTALRLVCGPLLVLALLERAVWPAFALFWLAVGSDLLDGRVARRYGEVSALGGFLDHVTDAAFVSLGLAALALRGEAPALLPAAVAFAFLQYTLDSRVLQAKRAARPREALPRVSRAESDGRGGALVASALGRWNGIAYFVPIGTVVVRDALALGWPAPRLVLWLGWALVATTLLSMADRAFAIKRARGPGTAPGSRA